MIHQENEKYDAYRHRHFRSSQRKGDAQANPKAPSQGVNMTAAASGSSGITVGDDSNIDFGTGNFTLVAKGLYWLARDQ